MIEWVGLIAAVALPLWNIPLLVRMERRRSSEDVSLWWGFGVLGCLVLMLPSALVSEDRVFKVFTIANVVLFSLVVAQIVRFRARA